MPNFNSPQEVEQICYEMRLSDYPRGQNRARINELFNGFPPYSEQEARENAIEINVNYLEGTGLAHDARSQFYQNFLSPAKYFTLHTDGGTKHKRQQYNTVVTREMNRVMKKSLNYLEKHRSTFAQDVLHGIGPGAWENSYCWCPDGIGIEDVGIPAKTLLTMKNLPFFYLYRSYTAPELIKQTRGSHVDAGWNKPLAERCIKWIDSEMMSLMGSNWPEVWAPEKASERVKGDGGFYCGDQVPTVDTFDFYFYADDGKRSGWRRRIILDSWSAPGSSGKMFPRKSGDPFSVSDFLYSSKSENFADDWRQIVSFQFADLSAVAPFQYHSIRSLGFLLYAVCHLQNRLRCKFNESVFEALMMYFRVKTMDEAERVLKVNLLNRGFIDEALQFIPASERFQVNANLVELGLQQNSGLIQKHVSSYIQNPGIQDQERKNKLQVLAELNSMTMLVSAGLLQAYAYQNFENEEIKRRFFKHHSDDPQVNLFQARCLKQHVPEELLVPEAWDCEPVRTLGQGNKTMAMAVVEQLMGFRNLYDPEPQRQILRDFTLAITDDPARSEMLVPDEPVRVTDAVHDAQLAAGTLMQGLPVALKTGMDHIDYVETLLATMAVAIQKTKNNGALPSPEHLLGLQNIALHIQQHLAIIAKDEKEKERVKKYETQLKALLKEVQGFAQKIQQAAQAQQQQGGGNGVDPKTLAKVQDIKMTGEVKRQTMAEARAQRQAERQIEFEKEIQRDEILQQREQQRLDREHQFELTKSAREHALEVSKKKLEAKTNVEVIKAKAKAQPKPKPKKSE